LFADGSAGPATACNGRRFLSDRPGQDLPSRTHNGTARPVYVEAILDAVRGTLPVERLIYLATPINGGPSIVRSIEATERSAELVEENIRRARAIAARLRQDTGDHVFDPTCFAKYDGWDQRDYIGVCLAILERFAHTVVFADGWEYSRGCLQEYLMAVTLAIPCRSTDLKPITVVEVARRLANAVSREVVNHPIIAAQRFALDSLLALDLTRP
jgi:hypothetical protein